MKIFRYVTEGTFDSYSWQLIENKQKFIGQVMTSKSPVRSCEDVDEAALSYAEVKALATGNPYIREKMDLDIQVSKLKLMKANYISQKYRLEDQIMKYYPKQIALWKERVSGFQADLQTKKANFPIEKEAFLIKVGDQFYTEKREAGMALIERYKAQKWSDTPVKIGEYAGFQMMVSFDSFHHKVMMKLKGQLSCSLEIGSDPLGNLVRMNHALESITKKCSEAQRELENVERQLETAKIEVTKPFAQEKELAEKCDRLSILNALLNLDEKGEEEVCIGVDCLEFDPIEEIVEQDQKKSEQIELNSIESNSIEGNQIEQKIVEWKRFCHSGDKRMDRNEQKFGQEEKVIEIGNPYPVENARYHQEIENGNPQGWKLVAGIREEFTTVPISLKQRLEEKRAQVDDRAKKEERENKKEKENEKGKGKEREGIR